MEESKKEGKGVKRRLQEAKVQQAETERALSVAIAKIAHASIETIEKTRKKSLIVSLITRIELFIQTSTIYIDMLKEIQPTSFFWRDYIQSLVDTYKSIRKDIKDNLEIKDFEELFPERPTYFETLDQAVTTIIGRLEEQLNQLRTYLLRYLF